MEQYIPKYALVAEIERIREHVKRLRYAVDANCIVTIRNACECLESSIDLLVNSIDTLEVKEVDLDIEKRIKECPFRQVACNRYEDTPVICDGRCSWVADYPKLKELKAQKGE